MTDRLDVPIPVSVPGRDLRREGVRRNVRLSARTSGHDGSEGFPGVSSYRTRNAGRMAAEARNPSLLDER